MRKLTNIQHLRALAALLVVVGHALVFVGDLAAKHGQAFTGLRLQSQFGVDVFFVISGFIMYHTSVDGFGGPQGAGEFMRRRLVRIAPIYWLTTAAQAAILFVSRLDEPARQIKPWQVLLSLVFWPYDGENGKMRPILGVGWTLNFEMYFYVVFAVGMLFALRRGLAVVFGFMLLMVAAASALHPGLPLAAWGAPIVLEFLIGIGLGMALRAAPAWKAPAIPAILLALVLVAIQGVLPDPPAPVAGVSESVGWRPLAWALAGLLVASALVVRQSADSGWIGKGLTALGNASYSLYLTHAIVFALMETVLTRSVGAKIPPAATFTVLLGASVAVGWFTHVWVERPLTGRLNRWTGGRWPPPIVDSVR